MKSNATQIIKTLLMLLVVGTFMTACSSDDDDATVSVKLTDDPFPIGLVSEAQVGVAKVELVDSEGNTVTVFEGNTNVNMVNYRNGVTAEVGVNTVPPGTYVQARVTLSEASVTLQNQERFQANVATSFSYGVTINPAIEVGEGEEANLLLDLDLSDSFKFEGNFLPGSWIQDVADITGLSSFEPDFRAVCLSKTGTIEGQVTDANGAVVAYAYVEVEYDYNGDGVPDSVSTIADENGHYAIAIVGLPEGTYTVRVETETATKEEANISVSVQQNATVDVTIN